jgi:hypothetical protein
MLLKSGSFFRAAFSVKPLLLAKVVANNAGVSIAVDVLKFCLLSSLQESRLSSMLLLSPFSCHWEYNISLIELSSYLKCFYLPLKR